MDNKEVTVNYTQALGYILTTTGLSTHLIACVDWKDEAMGMEDGKLAAYLIVDVKGGKRLVRDTHKKAISFEDQLKQWRVMPRSAFIETTQ